jgi:recombination protein RecA
LKRDAAWRNAAATVISIRRASGRQMRDKGKYDISVRDTKCYSAGGSTNGIIVHNSPDTTPGGLALKFNASLRVQINKGSAVKDGKETIGFSTNLSVKKNKCAPPFTTAEYGIRFGHPCFGVDSVESLLKVAGDMKLIEKSSSYFIFEGQKVNGYDAAAEFLRKNDAIRDALMGKIYANLRDRTEHLVTTVSGDDEGDSLDDDILDAMKDSDE